MKKIINPANGTITWKFDEAEKGKPETAPAPVVFELAKVSQGNRAYAQLHGFAARIGDNAAISKSAENGYKVTEEMRREAILELVDHYHSGSEEWNVKASGAKREVLNPHIQALAEKLGKSYAEAQAWFAEKLAKELENGAE